GGIDSCALLHQLIELKKKPIVLHFNHQWRPESEKEATFVQDLAKRYRLLFYLGKSEAPVKKTETEARMARWKFFKAAALRSECFDLVLAHHADDHVETFLMQLLRGTGSGGKGMARKNRRDGLTIHRPWLHLWRSEIESYARKNRLDWREDKTNQDTA